MKSVDKKAPAPAAATALPAELREDAAAASLPENKPTADAGGIGNASEPPRGEEIDGGDVEEVIKLDAGEAITVVYKGFKVTKGTKPGETNRLHKLIMADGKARGVWGTMTLNGMLDKCRDGDTLWIAYLGKDDLPGGKTMHNWKVVRTKKSDLPF